MTREVFDASKVQEYIHSFDPNSLIRKSIERLSYSKIASYVSRCKMRYFFQRVLRIKIPDEFYFYLGERVHNHCQRFWEQDFESAESFAKQFAIHFINRQRHPEDSGRNPGFFRTSEKKNNFWFWLKTGQEYVRNYYYMREGERQLEIPRLIEMSIGGNYQGHRFEARLDEVSVWKDQGRILDIKTIRNPPRDKATANFSASEQYPLYMILLTQWLFSHAPEEMLIGRRKEVPKKYDTQRTRDKAYHELDRMESSLKIIRETKAPTVFELLFPKNSFRVEMDITREAESALEKTLCAFITGILSMDFPRKPLTGRHNCHNDCLYFPICQAYQEQRGSVEELSRMVEQGILIVSPRKTAPKPGDPLTYVQSQHLHLFLGHDPIVEFDQEPKKLKKRKKQKKKTKGPEQYVMTFA